MTFKQYRKIKQLGHEENKDIFSDPNDLIVIQEKVDGANFRFMVHDGQVIFGSRTQQLHPDVEHKFAKNFARCIEHVRKKIEVGIKCYDEIQFDGLIFYGECMVRHTIPYDWEKIPPFLGFDIYDLEKEKYLEFEEVDTIYNNLNLNMVPLLSILEAGTIKNVDDNFVPISEYPPKENLEMQSEGVVFKNYSKQIFAKYVRQEFKEKNSETFGGNPKYSEDDSGKIAHKFCTNARIDKMIFKLIDEDIKLEMAMMKHLPTRVYDDIIEEEYKEICNKKNNIDFRKLNKIITSRCKAVLVQMITNNALN